MTARQSSATDRALRHIARGMTAYKAAKKEGIALSTIYRAIKRQRLDVVPHNRKSQDIVL